MNRGGGCPYTISGNWPDSELASIIEDTLETSNPKCPWCGVEGVVRWSGEVTWCECPKCKRQIGGALIT